MSDLTPTQDWANHRHANPRLTANRKSGQKLQANEPRSEVQARWESAKA